MINGSNEVFKKILLGILEEKIVFSSKIILFNTLSLNFKFLTLEFLNDALFNSASTIYNSSKLESINWLARNDVCEKLEGLKSILSKMVASIYEYEKSILVKFEY